MRLMWGSVVEVVAVVVSPSSCAGLHGDAGGGRVADGAVADVGLPGLAGLAFQRGGQAGCWGVRTCPARRVSAVPWFSAAAAAAGSVDRPPQPRPHCPSRGAAVFPGRVRQVDRASCSSLGASP